MKRYMIRRNDGYYADLDREKYDCFWVSRDAATLFEFEDDAEVFVKYLVHSNQCRGDNTYSYEVITLDIDAAVRLLIALDEAHSLGDFIYDIRERECEGWKGPLVTKWGRACMEAQNLIAEYRRQTSPIEPTNSIEPTNPIEPSDHQ